AGCGSGVRKNSMKAHERPMVIQHCLAKEPWMSWKSGRGARMTLRFQIGGRAQLRLQWRTACFAAAIVGLTAFGVPGGAQRKPETTELFRRMFATDEFEPKTFGPAKWLEGGSAYTTM